MYYWLFYEVVGVLRALGCVGIFFNLKLTSDSCCDIGSRLGRSGLEISIWVKEKFLDITSVLEMLLLSEKHSKLYKFSTVYFC